MKRIISCCLALVLFCATVLPCVPLKTEAASTHGRLSGETSRVTNEIKLNGNGTGVNWTQITLDSSFYKKELIVNAAEFSLANTNLSVEVINSGQYLVSKQTVGNAIDTFNSSHNGQTVLAAVNGDLWMTGNHYNGVITSGKSLCVSRGITLIDGEIWATQQIDQENLDATGFDAGKPTDEKNALGVTATNQPLVGAPRFAISMSVNGKTVHADGLNRLPCRDAIIIYNHRVFSTNYALTDSYEVELEVIGSAAFTMTGTVNARVKAIYPAGSADRPAIGSNTILLTARGNRISTLEKNFAVGDTVSFSTKVTDSWNNADMWLTVKDAIGGYIGVVKDNQPLVWNTTTSGYPSSFIGIKDDGTVAMVTVTRAEDGAYASLNRNQAYAFCMEYGYNRVFHLDGGGSCAFYTLENGTYTRRTSTSDGEGSERPVINAVAVVWNDTPVCEAQGDLNYIHRLDLANNTPEYLNGTLVDSIMANNHDIVSYGYGLGPGGASGVNAGWLYNPTESSDPYVYLNYSLLKRIDVQDYRYVVLRYFTTYGAASDLSLYYNCGSGYAASTDFHQTVSVKGTDTNPDGWQYVVFDMKDAEGWTGQLNSFCIDFCDGATVPAGTSFMIERVALCRTEEDLNRVLDGGKPRCDSHSYVTRFTAPSCGLEGATEEICSLCETVKTCTPIPALEHNYRLSYEEASTCVSRGRRKYTCSSCGDIKTERIPALDHDYQDGVCIHCDTVNPDAPSTEELTVKKNGVTKTTVVILAVVAIAVVAGDTVIIILIKKKKYNP